MGKQAGRNHARISRRPVTELKATTEPGKLRKIYLIRVPTPNLLGQSLEGRSQGSLFSQSRDGEDTLIYCPILHVREPRTKEVKFPRYMHLIYYYNEAEIQANLAH